MEKKNIFVIFRSGKTHTFQSKMLNLFTMEPSPPLNNIHETYEGERNDDVRAEKGKQQQITANEQRISILF
jgi:hypothetical protein